MLMEREPVAPVEGRKVSGFMLAFVSMTCAALVPLLLPLAIAAGQSVNAEALRNSVVASLVATIVALVMFRRVTAYPGTVGFAYLLPSFSAAYGAIAAILLGLRLTYSGTSLLGGYIAATVATFICQIREQRLAHRHFYVLPQGKIERLADAPGVSWSILSEPRLPADPHAEIVADLRYDYPAEWERMLADAAVLGHPVYHIKQLHESLTGKMEIEHLSENSFGSLIPNLAYFRVKRLLDFLFALAAVIVLAVPLAVVAVAIRLDSAGPSLFRQQRMGFRARPFTVYKFRTMRHRNVSRAESDERHDAITRPRDDRITGLGRVLRRTRIDELPQIFNVLRGEMSLIGPRPEALPLSQWYEVEVPFYRYRHIVLPGITGWAQVNQGHVVELGDAHIKLHYDFYYIKHFSAWLDTLITLRTVAILITGFGSK